MTSQIYTMFGVERIRSLSSMIEFTIRKSLLWTFSFIDFTNSFDSYGDICVAQYLNIFNESLSFSRISGNFFISNLFLL